MQTTMQTHNFLERLLTRTGGWYIILVALIAQAAASVATLLTIVFEDLNAEYSPEAKMLLNRIEMVTLPAVILVLIVVVFLLTRPMRMQLDHWKQKPEQFGKVDSQKAWKSVHNLFWQYTIFATIVSLALIIIPKTVILSNSGLVNQDQIIYGLIGGIVSVLASVPLSTILIDMFMMPVRNILVPKEFSAQLSGLSKIRILYKFLAVVFISLFITALLIAPIGYHQTTRVLYTEIGSFEVLGDLQIQSILVSGFAIILAASLAYLIAKSTSDPLQQLLESFQKIESGDLNTRMPVTSSDEISRLAIYFNRMVSRLQELQSDLEKKVDERTSQLRAINEVGRVATSILDPEELLKRVVNLITEEFGYYYAAIYLIDQTREWCNLVEATGEAGRVLKESKHQLEISSTNIISKAVRTRQAQVSVDVGEKATRFNNPLLSYTRSEISLPLLVGDQILGALDVHSTKEAAFNEHDIETLQNMANQVAISLDNARLFQETRQGLNELRNIQKQYLREAWIDSDLPQGGISLVIGDAADIRGKNSVQFPITLRDQIIGQLRLAGDETMSQEDKNWIQAIVTQAALALENARLLEESQSAAMREKFVTEITNKIWSSTTIDGVLQTAVRELGQILDATEATIELDIEGE